ncbi:MAG: O-antigen ligase family protein [Solirubrobacteraceae bacterium]
MSTLELWRRTPRPPDSAQARGGHSHHTALQARAPVALGAALLLVLLYGAFAHGAAALTPGTGAVAIEARIQVVIAAIAAFAGGAWLWTGSLRVTAPALALGGAGLLSAFAAWSGVALLWSVAPDQTWIELNRTLTYLIVLGLAIAVGASHGRSVEMVAKGFLLVALAVSVYALGQKLLPGLHIAGVFDLNQTDVNRTGPRLQQPFGYWNALALFVGMGAPVALALATDTSGSGRWRAAALLALELMLLTIAFTFSRGGLLALAAGLTVGIAVSRARLRSLLWLGTVAAASIAPLVFGLTNHPLTAAGISLSARESAGAELMAVLVASFAVLYLVAALLHRLERRVPVGPERAWRIGRLLLGAVGVAVAAAVLAIGLSTRGLDGTVSHAWKSFTATHASGNSDPSRLFSTDSENRWVWWKEAAGAVSDRPLDGWGPGSFGVVHLLYRRDTLSVQQPHSVPLQLLAETGIVGALLGMGGFALLLASAVAVVRRLGPGRERLLAGALLAGAAAYGLHACYDWDSDIPGVTLPAIVLLGVLAGAGRRRGDGEPSQPPAYGPGARLIGLGTMALVLCVFALSSVLPSLAAGKASAAVLAASGSSPAQLVQADADGQLASRLDPLSAAGPRAQATVAINRRQFAQARVDLLEAIRREPSDVQSWNLLAFLELSLRDVAGGARATLHALELDPHAANAQPLAERLNLLQALPQDSATAIQTPPPPGRKG